MQVPIYGISCIGLAPPTPGQPLSAPEARIRPIPWRSPPPPPLPHLPPQPSGHADPLDQLFGNTDASDLHDIHEPHAGEPGHIPAVDLSFLEKNVKSVEATKAAADPDDDGFRLEPLPTKNGQGRLIRHHHYDLHIFQKKARACSSLSSGAKASGVEPKSSFGLFSKKVEGSVLYDAVGDSHDDVRIDDAPDDSMTCGIIAAEARQGILSLFLDLE